MSLRKKKTKELENSMRSRQTKEHDEFGGMTGSAATIKLQGRRQFEQMIKMAKQKQRYGMELTDEEKFVLSNAKYLV